MWDFLTLRTRVDKIGTFRDHIVGTVRFLISNILSSDSVNSNRTCFSAVQIRRPPGSFYGVTNIVAMVATVTAT
ncbi:hypothetical protein A2U01_0080213 [Trifolium medium]|uniref:Uncharacterized protein n=1 Tax=Trifolium medium TaxID=97028 RepID=A0A392TD73_9FABA|nr:hypothetical protein [Trifolium medium]